MADEPTSQPLEQQATAPQAPQEGPQDPQAVEQAPPAGEPVVEVAQVELPEAVDTSTGGPGSQIDILLNTCLSVSACLGEAKIEVREMLQLGPGSVLRLDRRAGEPVDLYLRGIRFATGQLVVVGDQLGVRIKEIFASMPNGKK